MSPQRKLQVAIAAIAGLLCVGTIGFRVIVGGGWFESFYFTLITITSIGYSEIEGMNQQGRYFAAVIIILGVGTVGYALSAAIQAVLEFELLKTFGRRKMFKDINNLENHYIICGAGRVGQRVIREVARSGQDFVVIEQNEGHADRLLHMGYLVLMGDATDDDVLRAAGLERARGLLCAVSSDPDNLYITLTARDINRDLMIVARANDESAIKRLEKAGANRVVSPTVTGSQQMAQMLLRPAVADFIELATISETLELEIEQISIGEDSPLTGTLLKDTGIRSTLDVIVIAIKRAGGEMLFNPSAETVIERGDALIAIGSHKNLTALEQKASPTSGSITHHRH